MELPSASVVHAVPGRARIRISAKRGDGIYFSRLEGGLKGCPGVRSVHGNARAGSVLIHYASGVDLKSIADHARRRRIFNLAGEPQKPLKTVREVFAWQLQQADRIIATGTRGHVDAESLFFAMFLGLGLLQMWRGQIMQPAIPLLWRAIEILKEVK